VLLALAALAYHQGVVTDPGGIPDSWKEGPEVADVLAKASAERKRSTGAPRFCLKEQKYKPDRAHYCSALGRNVLRMDHYCPWLSNCVGHYNHKFFVQFLAYTVASCILASTSILAALCRGLFPAGLTVMMGAGVVLSLLLTAVLGPFLSWHLWLLSRNMTTIEFCERWGGRVEASAESPYDLGVFANFCSVFGWNPLFWLLPFGAPEGDGLSFPRRPGCRPARPVMAD